MARAVHGALSPGRRISLLVCAAALGAVGVSLISPAAQAGDGSGDVANRQAALILAEQSGGGSAGAAAAADPSPAAAAAVAVAQAQARAHALAAAAAAPPSASSPATSRPTGPDAYRAYALSKVGATQFECLDALWDRESHWRPTARNPSSTAYGIPQLLDSTWAYTGVAKTSDGYRQVDAGLAYLRRAYPGGPCTAWAHEQSRGWY